MATETEVAAKRVSFRFWGWRRGPLLRSSCPYLACCALQCTLLSCEHPEGGAVHWPFYACIFPFSMVCSTREGKRMLSFTSHSKTSDWAMCSQEKDLSMEGWKHRGARCRMCPQLASHLLGTASLTRLYRTCPPVRVLDTAESEDLGRKWETVLEPSWDVLLNLRQHPSPPWLPGNDLCDSVLFLLASWDWGISWVGTLPRNKLWQIWAAVDSVTCELKLQSAWVHLRSVADTRGDLLPHITHNVSLLPEDAWGGLML